MGRKEKNLKVLEKILNVYSIVGVLLCILATVFIFTPALPYIWYSINNNAAEQEVETITQDPADPNEIKPQTNPQNPNDEDQVKLPEFNPDLTHTNTLLIPKIGVNGEINEGTDAEAALEDGVWRVYNYGTPEDKYPIILASHRFGYTYWTNDFRHKSSFYNLPKTSEGDSIRIIWNQRRYEYEIYKVEEGTEISDYDADLILYTCKMFNSPVRVFRYAKRIN